MPLNAIRAPRLPRAGSGASAVLAVIAGILLGSLGSAQTGAPTQVRWTEAVERRVPRTVELPGTVVSRFTSVVASEVAGVATQLEARAGDRVTRGQTLVRISTTDLELELRATDGQLAEVDARLDLARRSLLRRSELFASQIVSQDSLDDAVSEQAAWQGRRDELVARIERLRTDLERSSIRSPFDGVVVAERTEVGEWVARGGPVAEIVSTDAIEIEVDVPERYYLELQLGRRARVQLTVRPEIAIAAEIVAVVPAADPRARTFPVKVRPLRSAAPLAPGMLVTVLLPIGDERPAVLVPKDAIVTQGAERLLWRVDADSVVAPMAVRPGVGHGAWVVIGEGVSVGDRVVTRGNERLRPGETVVGELLEYPLP